MLKDFASNCISALPLSARLPIEVAKFAIKDSLRNWTSAVYLVKGQIAGEFRQGSMIYFGEQHRYYRSWVSKFFADTQPVSSLGRMRVPDILRIKGVLAEHDLVLCPVNWLTAKIFSMGKWLIIPRHIYCVVDLRRPIKEIFDSRSIKKKIGAIRKFEYSFKVLRTESALTEFFYEMLLPTVRKRHQDRAFISNFQHLKSVFANGFLLAAYRGSEWVGAKLVHYQSNNTLRSANVAWRDGDEGPMKDHVGDALLFELINRGKAEGFEFLDLGNCLPFVDDGVLSFKTRWRADLVFPHIRFEGGKLQGATGFLAAAFNLTSQSGQAMLHHNPVLVCHKGAVKAVGWNSPIPTTFRRQVKRGVEWIDMAGTLL